MGKLGALFGSYIFGRMNDINSSLTFCLCALFCCVGVGITWALIDPPYQNLFFVKHNHVVSAWDPNMNQSQALRKDLDDQNIQEPYSSSFQMDRETL